MSGIRFVHTDHLRLGSSIRGLANPPEWLRRQARDAGRESVQKLISVAGSRNAQFLYVGGRCTETNAFLPGVIQWLKQPFSQLRARGTAVVMTAESSDEVAALAEICDAVVEPGQRLDVARRGSHLELRPVPIDASTSAELVIEPAGESRQDQHVTARCHYVVDPAAVLRSTGSNRQEIHRAGSPQAIDPEETGEHGCLLVEAHPETGAINATFEATDVIRFKKLTLTETAVTATHRISEAIINASRQLARQESRTMVVDWRIDHPVDSRTGRLLLREDSLLKATREMMQEGHVGIWPRRIEFYPTTVNVTDRSDSASLAELASILFPPQSVSRHRTALAEFALGADYLNRVA